MGVSGYVESNLNGEDFLLRSILKKTDNFVILDVGANVGNYSNNAKLFSPSAQIYAFEPHPKTFQLLQIESFNHGYTALNLGCSDSRGEFELYDYQESDSCGSEHASFFAEVFQDIYRSATKCWKVQVTTIDDFVKDRGISEIGLLKIDTEGNEYKVLQGARRSIQEGKINVIQFEFSHLNVVNRVFLKDFFDILHNNYSLYRLLPDGLAPLENYTPLSYEIFGYQNIVAVRQGFDLKIPL